MKNKTHIYCLLIGLSILVGCKDFVQVDIPPNQLSSTNVFKEEGSAKAAIAGIYANIATGPLSANIQLAMEYYFGSLVSNRGDDNYAQFMNKSIQTDNPQILSYWSVLYQYIHQTNTAIESLEMSGIRETLKGQLLGEALFIRAFCYYYLVNLWGEVPLVLSTDWQVNQDLGRSEHNDVYKQMVTDLEMAKGLLEKNIPQERVRVNYYSSLALLSRVYLEMEQWQNAEENASAVIANSNYALEDILDIFTKDSREVIWQLMSINPGYQNTNMGQQLIPSLNSSIPNSTISDFILNQFEIGDLRKEHWMASNIVNDVVYVYPFKYKEGGSSAQRNENLVTFRLAEQYLNRARAKLMLGDMQGSLDDLNHIRLRGSLPIVNLSTEESILTAIQSEREKEFFAEWGIGWLGGGAEYPFWPIPLSQLETNPHLEQNPTY